MTNGLATTERMTSITLKSGLTFSIEGKTFASRRPNGSRIGLQEEFVCPDRDVSRCDKCADKYANIIEVYGTHYWVRDYAEWLEQVLSFAEIDSRY